MAETIFLLNNDSSADSSVDASVLVSPPFQENEMLRERPESADLREPSRPIDPASPPYGIDIERGLRYAGGKLPLYHKLIRLFLDTHGREFAPQFEVSFASGDWKNTMRLAHTLKSAARMIGAAPLGEMAELLETACLAREEEKTSIIFNELKPELEKICAALAAYTAEY